MIYSISAPRKINASIQLPASKSISNRALIINTLTDNPQPIANLSDSDDTKAMLNAFQNAGNLIDVGAAGTAMRFLTAYYAIAEGERTISGSQRMKNRPIRALVDALRSLGAEIEYVEKEGFPPLKIQGKRMTGGKTELDGSISSQYLSALMMIAPAMENGLEIRLSSNIVSRPYIEMTRRIMEYFGQKVDWTDNIIAIKPGKYEARPFAVESDWSAASYWFEIAAMAQGEANINLSGLNENSWQGDSKAAELFYPLGLPYNFTAEGLEIKRVINRRLPYSFEYDFTDIPDLAQTFAVSFCCLGVKFRFTGLQSLKIKETDRIAALQAELRKLGFLLESDGRSTLEWQGEVCEAEPEPVIATYDDHRMAMAFAPACLKFGKIKIENPKVVSKSYPDFWKHLQEAGFVISEL
ncbi:MAG: 3-phosphoshikimate 1-carboxyvinyltransferase [Dysgonamonadaceae bacterium]|jgi:3-phosphoshikimate 1-carboxyvinyltransferase|nr:3-phosphoshikimate 1-carboxyvinyltransferase [Dysgonamonadaceae bacterium]